MELFCDFEVAFTKKRGNFKGVGSLDKRQGSKRALQNFFRKKFFGSINKIWLNDVKANLKTQEKNI